MFRLHIDIPISAESLESAQSVAREVVSAINIHSFPSGISELNYRLGHDDDRQKSNYLDMDAKGHCSNRKIKIQRETND